MKYISIIKFMNFWVGVASKEHVLSGKIGNFIQVCHGKKSALSKLKKNDFIIYYSPKEIFDENEKCQKFTGIAKIIDENIYQYKMNENFIPYRRNVNFFETEDFSILSIIKDLSFIKNKKNWGFVFRKGLFLISFEDFKLIAEKMNFKICMHNFQD